MAILSSKDKQPGYTALPSYLTSDAIISETNQLQATLKATSASLDKDIEAKNDEVNSLKSGYRGGGSSPMRNIHGPSGSALDGEAFFAREEGKQYKADRAALDKVIKSNAEINEKVAAIDKEIGAIHQKKRATEELLTAVNDASRESNVFDTAHEIAHLEADKQVLFLSVLVRGKRFSFTNGSEKYESSDVRVLREVLQRKHIQVALV